MNEVTSNTTTPNSNWRILDVNTDVQHWKLNISYKTRLESTQEIIPNSFYAPIIYQFTQKLTGPPKDLKIILSKITLVDTVTNTEIKLKDKAVFSGNPELALTWSETEQAFVGTSKIQFNINSHNVNGKEFSFLVSLYFNQDIEKSVFKQVSSGFKVYARKPYTNRKPKETIKRKEEVLQNTQVTTNPFPKQGQSDELGLLVPTKGQKKQKLEGEPINGFEDFAVKLEELLDFNKKLGETDKRLCMNFVIQRIMDVDPKVSQLLMLNHLQQSILNNNPTLKDTIKI